jgi:hypothetical protein
MDLPGLDDQNDVRMTHMTEQMKKAKLIWVITDKNLEASKQLTDTIIDSEIIPRVCYRFLVE